MTGAGGETGAGTRHRWVGIVAVALFVVTGFFPYLASGLLVPLAGLVVLMFCWGIGLVITVKAASRRPLWSLAAAPLAVAFWWVYVTVGEALFGWTG